MAKIGSTKAIGLAGGRGKVKTTVIPPGTLPNDHRPADTYSKKPPSSWGRRLPK
jgi:hypothetical protein